MPQFEAVKRLQQSYFNIRETIENKKFVSYLRLDTIATSVGLEIVDVIRIADQTEVCLLLPKPGSPA